MIRRVVTVGPPPTPNGNLHLGHLAGPYLMGDIYTRYLRLLGHEAYFVSGTDDNQTYVDASAQRNNITEVELRRAATAKIRDSFALAGIEVHGWADYDQSYQDRVVSFVADLHDMGVFEPRTRGLPVDGRTGEVLVEGLVEGNCPHCRQLSRGGLCESCGKPVLCEELSNPHHAVDKNDNVNFVDYTILTLPLERYREQLEHHYNYTYMARLRPRMQRLVREVLSRPLIDYPITYPLQRGIAAPFVGYEDQVLNAWVEGMPASIECTDRVPTLVGEQVWRDRHTEITYFLGYDNIFYWGFTHVALLLAHGNRYGVPHQIYSNEFYEIEYEKASTSKGNVVNISELLGSYTLPAIRFYLALSSPEFTKRSFVREELESTAHNRLVTPWNKLVNRLTELPETSLDPEAVDRVSGPLTRLTEHGGFSAAHLADYVASNLSRVAALPHGSTSFEHDARAALWMTAPLLGLDPLTAQRHLLKVEA